MAAKPEGSTGQPSLLDPPQGIAWIRLDPPCQHATCRIKPALISGTRAPVEAPASPSQPEALPRTSSSTQPRRTSGLEKYLSGN